MLPGGNRIIYMIYHMLPGLDLYYADTAQPLTAAGEELDDPDHDLSDLSVQGVQLRLTVLILVLRWELFSGALAIDIITFVSWPVLRTSPVAH